MKLLAFLFTVIISISSANAQWQKYDAGTDASFRGLDVVSENVVWASGTGGTVIRTIDGGKKWDVIKVPGAEKLDFRDIEAFDANTAYILSIGNGESSRIFKTNDGGKNWKLQFKNMDEKAFFDSIAFWDAKNGMAQSDPIDGKYVFYRTTDGENWTKVSPDNLPAAKDGEAAFAASGTCIITHGKKSIWLISGGMDARVFFSKDRGSKWHAYETPMIKGTAGSGIFGIEMFDSKRGVIVGGNYEKPDDANGNVAYTNDGGKTWTGASGLGGYRSGIAFRDKDTAFAVGSNGSDRSLDGGKTWASIGIEDLNAVQSKLLNVWAVGPKGLIAKWIDPMPISKK